MDKGLLIPLMGLVTVVAMFMDATGDVDIDDEDINNHLSRRVREPLYAPCLNKEEQFGQDVSFISETFIHRGKSLPLYATAFNLLVAGNRNFGDTSSKELLECLDEVLKK